MGAECLLRAGEDSTPEGKDDWYANLVDVRGCRCVVLTHVDTLFPVVFVDVAPTDLSDLAPRLRDSYAAALSEIGIPRARIAAELLRLGSPQLARTLNKSVLASMKQHTTRFAEMVAEEGRVDAAGALRMALRLAELPLNGRERSSAIEAVRRRLV
jgi:hypothetical protein